MKVLFVQDVPGKADAGEIKEVKNGYARNYLIPNNIAVPATEVQLQRINIIKKQAEERSQMGGRNKGWDAMEAALQTISVYQSMQTASQC